MTATENNHSVALPQALRAQFSGLEQRLWRTETLGALCLGLSAVLLSWIGLFISDRFWDTPNWLRIAFTAAGLLTVAACALGWAQTWIFKRRDLRAMAVLVQRRFRRLGDRLLGIVELADERQRPAHFSPALYHAAIEQVATEARSYDFTAAVEGRSLRRAMAVCAGAVCLAILPVLLSAAATANAWARWIAPASDIDRFTLVKLDGFSRELVVPHGEPFLVNCLVEYRSWWKPRGVVYHFEQQSKFRTRPEGDRVEAQVPGQVQRGVLRVRLGDASVRIAIVPTYRPSLRQLNARIQLPAYLQQAERTENVEIGSLGVLEGSRVGFTGKASRALSSAELRAGDALPNPLQLKGDEFSSDRLDLDNVSEVGLTIRDQFGLTNAAPWRLQIRPEKDSPATPELPDLLKDTAILESEVLELKTVGTDDYGVREIGLGWQFLTETPATNTPAPARLAFQAQTTREKKLEETFHFSPGLLMLPADSIVELRGFASDYFPDRPASLTPPYRIHILGNERHAELIRQSLESLLSRLEEVTRLEEKVAASTRDMQQLPNDKLKAEETADRLAATKEEQSQNASGLEQMAKEGKKTLREAFRNPTFTEETLKEWTKNLQEMQQLSQEQMQHAAQTLKAAQQNAEERSENLSKAAQQEQEVLDALERMQRNVNKGLDQLQALTLAQRLRKISSDEKGLATRLQRIAPEVVGMFPKELPPAYRNTEATLATEQDAAQKETQVLHGEIGRFFERTQKDTYGEVHKQMIEAKVTDELDRIRGRIEENISMEAMQDLGSWSDRLKAWAELLEPKSDNSSAGGGGGGGGNAADEALMKELLGLLRLRDREVNLRQRTALLDRQKDQAQQYQEGAHGLATTQTQVREDLTKLQGENPVPALEFPLQDVAGSMQGVEALLAKPQTDRTTDLAQTKTVELLSDVINLINEQQRRQNSSSSSRNPTAEEMAFLTQMMALQNNPSQGMGVNPNGGGSTAGGTTDRAATPVLGDPNAKAAEDRTVSRASGRTAAVPTEFRDALDNYYKAVEQLERK